MDDKRFAFCVLLGGVGLGIVSLTSPAVRDFIDGFLGIPLESSAVEGETVELRAELASPALSAPLQTEQMYELSRGLLYLLQDQYADAVPILGKYALLGDGRAQSAIGSMYYFGMGLPVDHAEGVRWLALAAAQGTPDDRATLADAINGRLEWERSEPEPEMAYDESPAAAPQYDFNTATGTSSFAAPRSVFDNGSPFAIAPPSTPPMGARASTDQAYGSEAASRRYTSPAAPSRPLDFGLPVILNRAGPGTYSDGSGNIYAQAGPNGVINTRTGEFSPTN